MKRESFAADLSLYKYRVPGEFTGSLLKSEEYSTDLALHSRNIVRLTVDT